MLADVLRVLARWREADRRLSGRADLVLLPALADMKAQVGRLVHRGFVSEMGAAQLAQLPRYLQAVQVRLDKLADSPGRDRLAMDRIVAVEEAYLNRVAAIPQGRPPDAGLVAVRWMLEELRVSLWAQQLGTPYPVSETGSARRCIRCDPDREEQHLPGWGPRPTPPRATRVGRLLSRSRVGGAAPWSRRRRSCPPADAPGTPASTGGLARPRRRGQRLGEHLGQPGASGLPVAVLGAVLRGREGDTLSTSRPASRDSARWRRWSGARSTRPRRRRARRASPRCSPTGHPDLRTG